MYRGKQQTPLPRNVCVLLFLRPAWIGRCDVIDRGKPLLVRARYLDVGKVPGLVRRSFCYLTFLSSGYRDDVFFLDEFSKLGELFLRRFDQIRALGLNSVRLGVALD